jgi:hypothetical protein
MIRFLPLLLLLTAAADGEVRVIGLDEIWDPVPQVANERRLFKSYPSAGYTPDDVEFVIDERLTGQARTLSVIGFRAGPGMARVGTFEIMPGGLNLAEFSYDIPVRRAQDYFIWKIIVPLSIIVFMSWAAFWIDPAQIGPRLGVSVTSVLTLIASRFLLGALLPRISYLTRLDIFILGATVLVFLGLVEVVGTSNVAAHRDGRTALRLNRWSRVAFPIAFIAIVVWAFWL